MSKPGPKPKPTAIRKFEGNPGNLPLNDYEPDPDDIKNIEAHVDWMDGDCEYMRLEKFPLHEVSKLVWDRAAPELVRLGVLTEVDRYKFARYCETFARWLKMKAFIDKNGEAFPIYGGQFEPVYDDDGFPVMKPDGSGVKHQFKKYLKRMSAFPQVAIYMKCADQLRKYEEEFGIGAASRTRIQTIVKSALEGGGAEERDEWDYASHRGLRSVKGGKEG